MNLDIEKALFDIPEGVEFPMELCHHLRTKLNVCRTGKHPEKVFIELYI